MPGDITLLLAEIRTGNRDAESRLASLVYDDLHRMAARYMAGERRDNSLQPTMLVHDAYLRLVDQKERNWQNHGHFFAVAAQQMRWILIDHAKSRKAARHGGALQRLDLDGVLVFSEDNVENYLALDQALIRLAEIDPKLVRIFEMKHFGGLTGEEIALAIGESERQVKRDWRFVKKWLQAELFGVESDDTGRVETDQGDHR